MVRRPGQQDILIVITSPTGVSDPGGFSPFEAEDPEELVFCCFFKEIEQRAAFLDRLRAIATEAVAPRTDRAAIAADSPTLYARLRQEGQSGEAFFIAVRWWFAAMQRAYHVYRLKIGFAPYQTSCIVSFRDLEPEEIQQNLAFAVQFLEREKSRVLDYFGLGNLN